MGIGIYRRSIVCNSGTYWPSLHIIVSLSTFLPAVSSPEWFYFSVPFSFLSVPLFRIDFLQDFLQGCAVLYLQPISIFAAAYRQMSSQFQLN